PHVAEGDDVPVGAVRLQSDVSDGATSARAGVVGTAWEGQARDVLELVDDLAVADHGVVLADDADLQLVPLPLGCGIGSVEPDVGEAIDRPGLARVVPAPVRGVVDLNLVTAGDSHPREVV